MPRRSDSLARPLLIFAGLALVALTVVAVTGALVVRQAATEQALAEAKQLTDVSARLVERRVNEGLLTGDAETLGAVASVVFDAVKVDPIVRVKIWSRDGTIVYSDQTELIGSTLRARRGRARGDRPRRRGGRRLGPERAREPLRA